MTDFRARPTTYNGIAMRSRLEARFAALWDHLGWTWEYEPRAYASPAGQYLPDFEIAAGEDDIGPMFVEVKGTLSLQGLLMLEDRMTIILASEPAAQLAIAVADSQAWIIGDARGWLPPRRYPAAWSEYFAS